MRKPEQLVNLGFELKVYTYEESYAFVRPAEKRESAALGSGAVCVRPNAGL